MNHKIGDLVTWRDGAKPHALSIHNCEILEIGEDQNGRPAARIRAYGQEVGAYLSDLHPEETK